MFNSFWSFAKEFSFRFSIATQIYRYDSVRLVDKRTFLKADWLFRRIFWLFLEPRPGTHFARAVIWFRSRFLSLTFQTTLIVDLNPPTCMVWFGVLIHTHDFFYTSRAIQISDIVQDFSRALYCMLIVWQWKNITMSVNGSRRQQGSYTFQLVHSICKWTIHLPHLKGHSRHCCRSIRGRQLSGHFMKQYGVTKIWQDYYCIYSNSLQRLQTKTNNCTQSVQSPAAMCHIQQNSYDWAIM